MVHLDHLNILHTQWMEHTQFKTISDKEIQGWIGWAKLLSTQLKEDSENKINKKENISKVDETKEQVINTSEDRNTHDRLKAFKDIAVKHNWDIFPKDFVE